MINDDRVSDVEAYLPIAKAFASDAVKNDEGCISMEVLVDPKTPGRVLYLSHFKHNHWVFCTYDTRNQLGTHFLPCP